MIAFRYGTVDTKLLGIANIGAGCANTALRAGIAAALAVTIGALGTMKTLFDSTFYADRFACFFTTISTNLRTFITLTAFLTPTAGISVATVTRGTMGVIIRGTLFTDYLTEVF